MYLDNFQLSAVARDGLLVLNPKGPFADSTVYYTKFIDQQLSLIADGNSIQSIPSMHISYTASYGTEFRSQHPRKRALPNSPC